MTHRKIRLYNHIMSGGTPKEFAADNGLSSSSPSKMLASLGIRKMFVTNAEHDEIMARRKLTRK